MKRNFEYTTQRGNLVRISLYGEPGSRPCILYIHGFKGFKDWGFVPYAGEYFASKGMTFVAFNFSHNGIGEIPDTFTEFDKFEKNTFSLEVEEAAEMIHLCAHTDFFGTHIGGKIGLIGHSRGGGIALLSALQTDDVSAVSTWASVRSFDRYEKKVRQTWKNDGYIEVVNSRTQQVFRMGLDILNDIEKKAKTELNIEWAARDLDKPLLIIHGEQDTSVAYYEAESLNIFANPLQTTMRLIPGGDHTFGAKEPFTETTGPLEQVLAYTYDFFQTHLS